MSKAIEGGSTPEDQSKPSRRRALSILAASAPVLAMGSALAADEVRSELSEDVAAAFARWRTACAAFEAAIEQASVASERCSAMLPDKDGWRQPFTAEQKAAMDAANELSGVRAAEEVACNACGIEEDLFRDFLSVPPKNMADVMLQSKHLKEWCHMAKMERPVELWLTALTSESWPGEASEMEAV